MERRSSNKLSPNGASRPRRRGLGRRSVLGYLAVVLLAVSAAYGQNGNIQPKAIEIDKSANLYPGDADANVFNPAANDDWVADSLPNTDVDPDPTDSIAIGIVPNVTGASGGTGHWNGVRVIDGIAGSDQDIFLNGGKENDVTTWNVGPGSVGSSKYDVTQAYIANNQTNLFLGMERRGNNGTTAFDFEFNQAAAVSTYVPTRTVGDVLLTFELKGSGSSGSADPHVFIWSGTAYVERTPLPAGVFSSINNSTIQPAPWGYVDSGGSWVLSPNIPRFEFAEATVPLSLLPGVNACGGSAFVQVRTRSSATATSDMKDTTKIFQYLFGGPVAAGTLTANCTLEVDFDSTGSKSSAGTTTGLAYSWQFQQNSADDGSGSWSNVGSPVTSAGGTFTAPSAGRYRAVLTVTESTGCTDSTTTDGVNVFTGVGGSSSLTADCDETFTYSASGSGGKAPYLFSWTIEKETSPGVWATSATFQTGPGLTSSGTLDVDEFAAGANGDGHYRATVSIGDAEATSCFANALSNEIDVAHALAATISKTAANGTSLSVTVALSGSATSGASYQWQRFDGTNWVDIANATNTTLSYSSFESDASPSASSFSVGSDSYSGKVWAVQLRLHVQRTLNGQVCSASSNTVTVKKLTAVDP